jgi:hypothetical protein
MLSTLRTDNLVRPFTTGDTAIANAYVYPSIVPQHSVPGLNEEDEVEVNVALSRTPGCEHPLTDEGDRPIGFCPYCRDAEADASMRRQMEKEQAQMESDAFDNSCPPPEGDYGACKSNRAYLNRLAKKGNNSKHHFDNFEWQEARRVAKGKSPRSNPRDKHDHRTLARSRVVLDIPDSKLKLMHPRDIHDFRKATRKAVWERDHPRSTIGVAATRIPNARHCKRAIAHKRNGPTPKPSTDEDKFDVNGYRAFDDVTFFHHTEVEEILLDFEAYYEAQEAAYAAHIAYEREMRKAIDLDDLHMLWCAGGI